MKCSICKKDGHNKRSCKTMITSVSVLKNEAKHDVKVELPIKVEMNSNISKLTNIEEFELCNDFLHKNNIITVSVPQDIAETVMKVGLLDNKNMSWTPWTEKSKDISFETSTKGVGDGENKVASEVGTKVLGQNSPFDMEFINDGFLRKYDVKKWILRMILILVKMVEMPYVQ